MSASLKIEGEIERPQTLSFEALSQMDEEHQVADLTRLGLRLGGDAVRLRSLLDRVGVKTSARFLDLHSSTDDFHVSIPLEPVVDSALIVYRADGGPLEKKAGGPFRFFIPDSAPCRTDEIDACANVKFVDRIELSIEKGQDSRDG